MQLRFVYYGITVRLHFAKMQKTFCLIMESGKQLALKGVSMNILILRENDIRRVFNMKDAIQANKDALAAWSAGKSVVPLRITFPVKQHNGNSQYMPAYDPQADAVGLKIVSNYPNNREKGLLTTPALVVMVNTEDGQPEALINGTFLTRFRTGALSGVATDLLARQNSRVFSMIGTGGQAECQLEAVLTVRPALEEVRIYSRDQNHLSCFVKRMQDLFAERFQVTISGATSAEEVVRVADILTTVTTSEVPVLDGRWLNPGIHINGVGAYLPHTRELDETTVMRADRIYVDTRDGCLREAGDLLIPIQEEKLDLNRVCELGELILGMVPGRRTQQEITLFKTVGFGGLDIVNGKRIVDRAKALGNVDFVNM